MAFTMPDKGTTLANVQSVVFERDVAILTAGIAGTDCVLSGCACTPQGTPDMTVAVAKGSVLSNGVLLPVTAANVTITTADATNGRIDVIVVNSSGTKAVRAGTAATAPKPPTLTANDVALAMVYVPANDTAIAANQIVDKRVIASTGPLVIKATTSAVTNNSTNAIRTYASVVLPSGLMAAGRIVRFRCGGNYLSNSGTGTWTLTIAYGGTTMFADATAATTADADRGAWLVEGELAAVTSSSEKLVGRVTFQTPGAKTAATTGIGDMAVTTHVNSPFRGTAAVDSDAGDRTLSISWTMSVSNSAAETVCDYAVFELI